MPAPAPSISLVRLDRRTTSPQLERNGAAQKITAQRGLAQLVAIALVVTTGCAKHAVIEDERIKQSVVDQVARDTAALRHLEVRRPIVAKASNREHLQTYLETLWAQERQRASVEVMLHRRLGLVHGKPHQIGVPKASPLIGGYYDPISKALFVVEDYALWVRAQYFLLTALTGVDWAYDTVLSHEIVHALQDQHFDLENLLSPLEASDFDRALARRALIESDANATSLFYGNAISPDGALRRQIAFTYGRLNYWLSELIVSASPSGARFSERRALGSYTVGLGVVEYILNTGGFAALSRMYADGDWPQSTEQLLNPAKFFDADAYDPPLILPPLPENVFPTVDGAPMTRLTSNSFGAWQLKLLGEDLSPFSFAPTQFANAWGGDRYAIFDDGEHQLFVWRLAFDDDAGAGAFEAFWRSALAERYPDRLVSPAVVDGAEACTDVRAGDIGIFSESAESLCIMRRGAHVVIVEGSRPGSARNIAARVWKTGFVDVKPSPSDRRPTPLLTSNQWEAPMPPAADLLMPAPRTLTFRFGLSARFRPGGGDNAFGLAPDFAAAWTARPGLMFSLPFAVTLSPPSLDAPSSSRSTNKRPIIVPSLTLGFLRGVLTEPAAAAAAFAHVDSGLSLAAHVQVAMRRTLQPERAFEVRAGAGLLVHIGSRIRFAPALALTSQSPANIDRPPRFPVPRLEIGASNLRGLTRHPLLEVQVFDALGFYLDSAFAFDVAKPKLREHVHAVGVSLLF